MTAHLPSVRRWIEFSLRALDENAERVRSTARVADLRADAYGHGLALVAERLDRHGFEAFVVSPGEDPGDVRTPVVTSADPYGMTGPELFGAAAGWRPVLRVGAEILAVKAVAAGEGVSYGHTWIAPHDTTLALVGAGYAHGIVRRASNTAPVLVGGAPRTIVGVISMDQLTVHLDGAAVSEGDDAVFFGDPDRGEPTLAQWQEATGIRALAITSRLSAGFARSVA